MSKFCPRCGTQVIDEANFCMKCGFDFRAVESDSAATPAPEKKQTNTQPQSQLQNSQKGYPWVQNSGFVNPNPVAGYETYNPTFHCRCEYCYFEFDYHTYDLGHRAWYPHGFVYCPRCHRPLRHKLEYEVITNVKPSQSDASTENPD